MAALLMVGAILVWCQGQAQIANQVDAARTRMEQSLPQLVSDLYQQSQAISESVAVAQALSSGGNVGDTTKAALTDLLSASFFDGMGLLDASGRTIHSTMQGMEAEEALAVLFRAITEQDAAGRGAAVAVKASYNGGLRVGWAVMQDGVLQGVALFDLSSGRLAQRLLPLTAPGIGLVLLDPEAETMARVPFATLAAEWRSLGQYPVVDSGWFYLLLTDEAALAGDWRPVWFWLALTAIIVLAQGLLRQQPPIPVDQTSPVAAETETGTGDDNAAMTIAGDDSAYRQAIVAVMALALDCWQLSRHKGKVELAEESGLWRVYMDRSSLQTRTLDKYLLIETLPRHPRWRDVVRTAEYVLRHCTEPTAEREALSHALARLKQHLRRVAPAP